MVVFCKACPKCGGALTTEKFKTRSDLYCMNCGYRKVLAVREVQDARSTTQEMQRSGGARFAF